MYFYDFVIDFFEIWYILKNVDIIKDMYNLCMYVCLFIYFKCLILICY